MALARLFDGVTAVAHDVAAEIVGDDLRLSQESGWHETVALALLSPADGGEGELRLKRSDRHGWRLVVIGDDIPAIAARIAKADRYGRWIDRVGLMPAVVIGALVTAAVVGIGYVAPEYIAPHVPPRWERNVGTALVGDFGDLRCDNRAGEQAIERLIGRMAPEALTGEMPIKVAILDVPMFNAAALPGGNVVVFKTIIDESDPDALAGVLAHEVAHVKRRHVTQALVREFGIGALIRLFAGDLGANANQIVSLSYTRANESEADADAAVMLKRINVSPKPMVDLFNDLAVQAGEGSGLDAEFLQSHPLGKDRAATLMRKVKPGHAYRHAFSKAELNAINRDCSTGEKAAEQGTVT